MPSVAVKMAHTKMADTVGNATMGVKLFPAVDRPPLQRFRRQLREFDSHAVQVGRIRQPRV
jgi:hypothetical protein